jgi:hypothetical protein
MDAVLQDLQISSGPMHKLLKLIGYPISGTGGFRWSIGMARLKASEQHTQADGAEHVRLVLAVRQIGAMAFQ